MIESHGCCVVESFIRQKVIFAGSLVDIAREERQIVKSVILELEKCIHFANENSFIH